MENKGIKIIKIESRMIIYKNQSFYYMQHHK